MTNKKVICLVLGIMCFALTAGICIQIRTVMNTNLAVSQNYEENNLRSEVLKYKEKYDNMLQKIEEVDEELQQKIENATENNSELEVAKEEIDNGNKLIGLSEVTGSGVIITLADNSKLDADSVMDPNKLIVHDLNILKVVNELKNAGAEAISINGQRVILTTSIVCGGNTISINDEKIGSPFVIQAIGLPESLANLERPGGYLATLESQGIEVELEKSNDITIPKYTGILSFKYAQSVN